MTQHEITAANYNKNWLAIREIAILLRALENSNPMNGVILPVHHAALVALAKEIHAELIARGQMPTEAMNELMADIKANWQANTRLNR